MLHGCTQTPEDFAVGTGMNRVAEAEGLVVVYPEQTRGEIQLIGRVASGAWAKTRPVDGINDVEPTNACYRLTPDRMRERLCLVHGGTQ